MTLDLEKMCLAKKLALMMGVLDRIPKNGHNNFHNYDYTTADDVADAVRAAQAQFGVAILPTTKSIDWRDAPPTKTGGVERIATVCVIYKITDGKEIYESEFYGEGQDRGDKAIYKAYTGAHKYFLLRTFNLSTGESLDPELEEEEGPPQRQARPPRQQQTQRTYAQPDANDPRISAPSEDRNVSVADQCATWKKRFEEATAWKQVAALRDEYNGLPKNERSEELTKTIVDAYGEAKKKHYKEPANSEQASA